MKITRLAQTEAGDFEIPAGYYLQDILVREKSGNAVEGGLFFGTTPMQGDIVGSIELGPNETFRLPYTGNQGIAFDAPMTVYYDACESWNNAEVDIYITLEPLTGV